MTDERSASDVTVDEPHPGAAVDARSFGSRLAAEREQRGLSQADVARFLNLRVAVVVAIEEENFAALPQMAFVRGYTRTYARLLDIDGAEITEALASWRDPSEEDGLLLSPASVPPRRGLGRSLHGHAGLVLSLLSILVAVVVAVLLWSIWPEGGFTGAATETESSQEIVEDLVLEPAASPVPSSAPMAAPAAEPRLRVGNDGGRAAAVAETEADAETEAEAAAPPLEGELADAADAADTAGFSVRRESAENGRLLRVFAGGEDLLRMSFSGDCWVELRDAEGRGVVSDLAREGQTLEVHGQGPFRLLLGYAHGVELAYNGEQVALTPHIRNDVASLVVGR